MTTPSGPNGPSGPGRPDGSSEPEQPLTPEREAAVRRLLGRVGSGDGAGGAGREQLPEEVAARLDATLADLVAERSGTPNGAPTDADTPAHSPAKVTDLGHRRRRRAVASLFAAAAVVAVGTIGVSIVQGSDDDAAMDNMTAGNVDRSSSALEEGDAAAKAPDAQDKADSNDSSAESALPQDPGSGRVPRERHFLRTDEPLRTMHKKRLREDLISLQAASLPHPAAADYSGLIITAPDGFNCAPGPYGRGVFVGVEYDDMPALVAFRKPAGSIQVAEILQCGTGAELRSLTLPAE